MNIKELIEELSKYPEDTIVVTEGYENGFNDIEEVKSMVVHEKLACSWWDGKYTIYPKDVVFNNDEGEHVFKDNNNPMITCIYLKSRQI